jgi:hypothetical protein
VPAIVSKAHTAIVSIMTKNRFRLSAIGYRLFHSSLEARME